MSKNECKFDDLKGKFHAKSFQNPLDKHPSFSMPNSKKTFASFAKVLGCLWISPSKSAIGSKKLWITLWTVWIKAKKTTNVLSEIT